MILVFDVGNTETTIGLFESEVLRSHWRVTTDVPRTPDEFALLLLALLAADGHAPSVVTGVSLASVVPPVTAPLRLGCERCFGAIRVVVVDARSGLPIRLAVDEPLTVGADRLVNTLAASRLYERDAIVVDLGTATTFDCITSDGVFLGGVIAPGVRTSAETLVRRTSKLPATELTLPSAVIGKRTEDCIRAGVMFGQAEAIDGLVRRIKAAWPSADIPIVIATGGLAEVFRDLCSSFDEIQPHLTLHGLRISYDTLVGTTGSTYPGERPLATGA